MTLVISEVLKIFLKESRSIMQVSADILADASHGNLFIRKFILHEVRL